MQDINLDKDLTKIISSYRNISRIFFKSLIYICFLLFAFLTIFTLFMFKGQLVTNDLAMAQETENNPKIEIKNGYIGNRINYGENLTYFKKYNISILGGYVIYTGDKISSYYNLASIYNGKYILPFNFVISKKDKIPSKIGYSLASIKQIMNVFVMGPSIDVNYSDDSDIKIEKGILKNQNQLKSLENDSIAQTFDLKCLALPISSPFCNIKAKAIISQLPNYNLSKDTYGIYDLFNTLKSGYKTETCDAFVKYNKASSKFDNIFEKIYSECGENYLNNYQTAKNFNTVNTELKNNIYNSYPYDMQNINEYKLLSMQRMIYLNAQQNIDNLDLIDSYLSFIGNLATDSKIDKYYFYETFVFNNDYLNGYISSRMTSKGVDPQTSKAFQGILEKIKNTNNGNTIFGVKGLISYINPDANKDIIDTLKGPERHGSAANFLDDEFSSYLNIFSNDYIILTKKYDNATAIFNTNGAVVLKQDKDSNATQPKYVYLNVDYKYGLGKFNILKTIVKDNPDLDKTITNKIKENPDMQLGDLIGTIKQYNYGQSVNQDFCSMINESLAKNNNNSIGDFKIIGCNDSSLLIKSNGIDYAFRFAGGKLSSIDISDKSIEAKVKKNLDKFDTILTQSFPQNLIRILNTKPSNINQEDNAGQMILVLNKMHNYLQTEAKIGTGNGGIYNVQFSLNGISFNGLINPNENYRLYNIFINGNIPVNNFSLNLIDVNQLKINQFRIETLDFLGEIDPNAIKIYLKK